MASLNDGLLAPYITKDPTCNGHHSELWLRGYVGNLGLKI